MNNTVTICENTLEPSTWQTFEDVEDVRELLVDHFGIWPETAHIYLDHVANNADITPYDDAGIERLGKVNGHFYVVVYPNDPITIILVVIAVVIAAVSLALVFLFRPSASATSKQPVQSSANNQLGDRQNQARPNQRISDIFGQLWDTFDLLAVPYTTFKGNVEYEHCYMCVGRGSYDFATVNGVLQLRDSITPLTQMDGASAKVYGPNSSPNGGAGPTLTVGATFSELVVNLQRFDGVNGQRLSGMISSWLPGNPGFGSNSLKFRSPNILENTIGVDWNDGFQNGDIIYLGGLFPPDANASDPAGIQPTVDLTGIYVIDHLTAPKVFPSQIFLSSPATINPNWSALASFAGGVSNGMNANMLANDPFWIGSVNPVAGRPPGFFIARPDATRIICNFVALQGSYAVLTKDRTVTLMMLGLPFTFDVGLKAGTQIEIDSTIVVGITPCDAAGSPSGAEVFYPTVLIGSHLDRTAKGVTFDQTITPGTGGFLIRARRSSITDFLNGDNVSDQVQWRDLYICSPVALANFGNVTTIQTLIKATPQSVQVMKRKLNALVTRQVPALVGGVFTGLVGSKNAADILCAMALDPYIGGRALADLDVVGIYAVAGIAGTVQNYFACLPYLTAPNEFCYTFDDSKISFEEAVADLATAIFCVAYRRGSVLSLSFEQQTINSTLLFNHRNKIPGSETRSIVFGMLNGNDGITLDYVEPNAPNYPNLDTVTTLYFPPNKSAVNPKKITTIGIRNFYQAQLLGWRLYQKLIYQTTSVQFDATEEAALLVLQDRIAIADNTRSDTQDGEVITQVVLLLTLSHNVVFDARFTYTIFLQHPDETVEAIPITAGANPNQVILGFAPTLPCVIDPANYANTTYMIVSSVATAPSAFLLSEKAPKGNKSYELKAVNYSDQYYSHDFDYKSAVTVDGLALEVMTTAPGPPTEVEGLFLEVMVNGPGSGIDVNGLFLEVIALTKPPNADFEGLFLEVMSH